MSLPSSKILKASKSIMAIADIKHTSPNITNAQSVNVIGNSNPDPDKKVAYPKIENPLPPSPEQSTTDEILMQIFVMNLHLYKHVTLKVQCAKLKR